MPIPTTAEISASVPAVAAPLSASSSTSSSDDTYGLIIIIVVQGALLAVCSTSCIIVTCCMYSTCVPRQGSEANAQDTAPVPIEITLSDMETSAGVPANTLADLDTKE